MSLSLSDGVKLAEAIYRIYSAYQQLEPANQQAIEAQLKAFQADETLFTSDWAVVQPDVDLIINTLKGTQT
jgi:hypothetical protein